MGLMARFGSERIRGDDIPEAMEAILIGRNRIEPKVAILKPLSSAISIATGGAFGSLFGQLFHLTSAERKTLLVAGAAAGMSATFGSDRAGGRTAVVRMETAQLCAGRDRRPRRSGVAPPC
jgi:chloride channel protein, CIC family